MSVSMVEVKAGKLKISLPCKIGDVILVIPSKANLRLDKVYNPERKRIYEQTISSISLYNNSSCLIKTCNDMCSVLSDDYGLTWFLTYAEAEEALKRLETS